MSMYKYLYSQNIFQSNLFWWKRFLNFENSSNCNECGTFPAFIMTENKWIMNMKEKISYFICSLNNLKNKKKLKEINEKGLSHGSGSKEAYWPLLHLESQMAWKKDWLLHIACPLHASHGTQTHTHTDTHTHRHHPDHPPPKTTNISK